MAKKARRLTGKILVVAACKNSNGESDFAILAVNAKADEIRNGDHLDLAEERLIEEGYEEPFVLFDEDECPPWLFDNVCQHCGVKDISDLADEHDVDEDVDDDDELFDDEEEDFDDEEQEEDSEEEDEEE